MGVRAQGGRRSPVFPSTAGCQALPLPNLWAWNPRPSLASLGAPCWVSEPGEAAHGARTRLQERVQSKLCQRRPGRSSQGPAGPGGGALCPEGSLQPAPRDPCPYPGGPSSHLAPAARHRERTRSGPARGSPAARTQAHARRRARDPHPSARPHARPLPLARARSPRRYRARRGSARCRRIVSRPPYIASRALGSGTRGRALQDKPLLLFAPSQQSTGGDLESPPHPCWLLSAAPLVPIPHK